MLVKWWKTMLLRLHINNYSISHIGYLSLYYNKTPKESNLRQGSFIWVMLYFRGKLWQQKENVSCVHGQDVEVDASGPLDFSILFSLQI